MYLDFVLSDPESLAVVLAIELDDKSHWSTEARKRDLFKDSALASAGVPQLRVKGSGKVRSGRAEGPDHWGRSGTNIHFSCRAPLVPKAL